MNLAAAIAMSTGNKARTYSDNGGNVVVQERYTRLTDIWLHVWYIKFDEVTETDIPLPHPHKLHLCRQSQGFGEQEAREKVQRGIDAGLVRFTEALRIIRVVHGDQVASERMQQLGLSPDENTQK